MNAWDEESRIARIESTKLQYQSAGPSQNISGKPVHEKQPITPPARIALFKMSAS